MTSVVEAKRAYYQSLGLDGSAIADLEAAYFEQAASGDIAAAPLATTTVAGVVKKAANVAALTGGESPTEAEFNALLTALKNAGLMATS